MNKTTIKNGKGKTSLVVHEKYEFLREYLLHPDTIPEQQTITIKNNRNIVKKISTPFGAFVLKDFKGMYFLNRLAYSTVRKSKAARSYINSQKLNMSGIQTPQPVAWADFYAGGLLTRSYFLSVYSEHPTLVEVLRSFGTDQMQERHRLLNKVAAFASQLHSSGIFHEDFSAGNILVEQKHGDYIFSMVDLNRVRFRSVGYMEGVRNLSKLNLAKEDLYFIIRSYAALKGRDADASVKSFTRQKKWLAFFRTLRKSVRARTLAPVERLLGRL